MSTFSSIFGSSGDKTNVDKNIDLLFKASKGPVSRQYSDRARTIIEIPVDAPKKDSDEDQSESIEEEEEQEKDIKAEAKRAKKKRQKKELNEDLESKYYDKLLKEKDEEAPKVDKTVESKIETEEKDESGSGSDSDSEDEEEQSSEAKSKRAKTVDLKEAELEKAERTVFVGNVNAAVVSSKQMYKKFKKLFSQYGKVQSIRFRSISFDDAVPRKVAFAKKKLHSSRDT